MPTAGDVTALNPAVVLTVSPTGLAVARSLAPRGVTVFGVDMGRQEIGHWSRWLRRDARIAYQPPGSELLDGLLAVAAEQSRPPLLFLAGDPYVEFVATHHEALRERLILADSMRPDVLGALVNKRSFYQRCEAIDVALPTTFFPQTEVDARRAAREVRYPAIVKPELGHLTRQRLGGEKLVRVENGDDLVAWWLRFREWGTDSVVQEEIEGPEANIFVAAVYTDANLTCRALFTACKYRQYPPMYGSGSYMEARWNDEIAALSIDLVKKLEYRGVCGTEYKWDARDGAWKLIELNPRPTLWYSLARASGVDVIWDAYCDLVGEPNPVHVNQQDDGVRWQLLQRDLLSAAHFWRRGELSARELWRTAIDPRRKDYAALSLSDPGLALGQPLNVAWKWWTRKRKVAA